METYFPRRCPSSVWKQESSFFINNWESVFFRYPSVHISMRWTTLSHMLALPRGAPIALCWPWPVTHCTRVCVCVCVLHLNQWREFARVRPHTTGQMEENRRWRSSEWHGSWRVFISLRCSSRRAAPRGRCRRAIPLPVWFGGVFRGVGGRGSPQSFTRFGVCRWALWGGCDDASGPVLVRVTTNDFLGSCNLSP